MKKNAETGVVSLLKNGLYLLSILKKSGLISLIILLLFNLFGYRLLLNYAQWQSDIRIKADLDRADYNEADLITITVPLSAPYQIEQSDFERVDGEISFQGKVLKYVKRKVSNGNLVLLCIQDDRKMTIQGVKNDFFKSTNDLIPTGQSKKSEHSKSVVFKNVLSDYILNNSDYTVAFSTLRTRFTDLNRRNYLPSLPHHLPEQPPDFL